MKILIVTDAWEPQTNGVVRTIHAMERELTRAGHEVKVAGPDAKSWSCLAVPFYPEIFLDLFPNVKFWKIVKSFKPDAIHISTEGPLGRTARRWCLLKRLPFTTAYHTRFPEYLEARSFYPFKKLVRWISYAALRQFHAPSRAVMVATQTIHDALAAEGFKHLKRWSRGVDTERFQPFGKEFEPYKDLKRPILLSVGRVSVEKNLEAFLSLQTEGSKVVIGSGPDFERLKKAYPDAHFMGRMEKETLARAYAAADLFVFPSKTDTFGLVLLEACAAGLRIAAYPVSGPVDVFEAAETAPFAVLRKDLQQAVDKALTLPDTGIYPRAFAEKHSWAVSAAQFFENLEVLRPNIKD